MVNKPYRVKLVLKYSTSNLAILQHKKAEVAFCQLCHKTDFHHSDSQFYFAASYASRNAFPIFPIPFASPMTQ